MGLHDGKGLNALEVADLFDAIDAIEAIEALGKNLRSIDDISRVVAYPLASLSGYITGRWGIYWPRPTIQEQILVVADELRRHIITSLDDNASTDLHQMKMDLSN